MEKIKKLSIIFLVFVLVLMSPLSVLAQDISPSDVSEEDRKKFDMFFGKDNWTINSEGYAECIDWNSPAIVPATTKLDNFIATGLGVTASGGVQNLLKGLSLTQWIDKHINTDINVQKIYYDNNKEDYKVTISKDAMEELHKNISDYITPLQGYYVIKQSHSKNEIKSLYSTCTPTITNSIDKFVDSNTNIYFCKRISTHDTFFAVSLDYYYYQSNSEIITVDSKFDTHKLSFIDWQSGTSSTGSFSRLPECISYSGLPMKIFYSKSDLQSYLKKLEGIGEHNFFVSSNFFNYTPVDLTFNLSTYNNTDYNTINNNAYNTINNNQTTIINDNGSISEKELQEIIDEAIKKAMEGITEPDNPDVPIPPDNPDVPSIDTTGIEELLKLILNKVGNIDQTCQQIVEQLLLIKNEIIDSFKSVLNNVGNIDQTTQQIVEQLLLIKKGITDGFKDILENLSQSTGDSFTGILDKTTNIDVTLQLILEKTSTMNDGIIEKLEEIITNTIPIQSIADKLDEIIEKLGGSSGNSFFDLLKDILSETVGNLLADLIKLFIGEGGVSDAILSPASALASSAQSRFPTCIPWDIVAIIGTFSAEPETPVFELPFSIPSLKINETIVIDFTKAESLAKLSRTMFELTFLLFLLIQTRNLYGAVTGKK